MSAVTHPHPRLNNLVQFPQQSSTSTQPGRPAPACIDQQSCIQSERIARLEQRDETTAKALEVIGQKLDRLQWWILGLAVSVAGGAIATLLSIAMVLLFKARPEH
jgi:hypothetical protein